MRYIDPTIFRLCAFIWANLIFSPVLASNPGYPSPSYDVDFVENGVVIPQKVTIGLDTAFSTIELKTYDGLMISVAPDQLFDLEMLDSGQLKKWDFFGVLRNFPKEKKYTIKIASSKDFLRAYYYACWKQLSLYSIHYARYHLLPEEDLTNNNKYSSETFKNDRPYQIDFSDLGHGLVLYGHTEPGKRSTEYIRYRRVNPVKKNEDSILMRHFSLPDASNALTLAVFDGHGIWGHKVSSQLAKLLSELIPSISQHYTPDELSLGDALTKALAIAEKTLIESELDTSWSGSTAAIALMHKNLIVTANVGDSRAVIGRLQDDGNWQAHDLTRDHKITDKDPYLVDEFDRLSHMGSIYQYQVGYPFRISLKNTTQFPGLTMSRALGDTIGKLGGVISTPELGTYYRTNSDKFLIVASDGVWSYLSSARAVEIVAQYIDSRDVKGATLELRKEARMAFETEEDRCDDTSIIIAFF